jgi:hypothetical protein
LFYTSAAILNRSASVAEAKITAVQRRKARRHQT